MSLHCALLACIMSEHLPSFTLSLPLSIIIYLRPLTLYLSPFLSFSPFSLSLPIPLLYLSGAPSLLYLLKVSPHLLRLPADQADTEDRTVRGQSKKAGQQPANEPGKKKELQSKPFTRSVKKHWAQRRHLSPLDACSEKDLFSALYKESRVFGVSRDQGEGGEGSSGRQRDGHLRFLPIE